MGPQNKSSEEKFCRGHRMGLRRKETRSHLGGLTGLWAHEHASRRGVQWAASWISHSRRIFFALFPQPSLPSESLLAVYPFPVSSPTPHSSWGPDSHSGSSFHLSAPGPPTLYCLLLLSLQHILLPVSLSDHCSLHFPSVPSSPDPEGGGPGCLQLIGPHAPQKFLFPCNLAQGLMSL